MSHHHTYTIPTFTHSFTKTLNFSEGSQSNISGGESDRGPAAMARAVTVHQDTMKVMYFA